MSSVVILLVFTYLSKEATDLTILAIENKDHNMGLQAAFISLHFICFFLNIPPLVWHIKSKNIPAITLLAYVQLMMINGFVGAIIWGGKNYAYAWNGEGWCDIMIRLQLAISVGISSSITCVSLNLLVIFLTNSATTFWFSNKWVKPSVEIFCSIIFPFIVSGATYFAQTTRYIINQYSGCSPALANYGVSIVTFYLWIFLWSFLGTVVSGTTLVLFFKKRKAAKEILVCTNSGLSVKKFVRLLAYCVMVITTSIVFSVILGSNINVEKGSFYDKDKIHPKTWGYVFKLQHISSTDINKWVLITISFISFFLFGIGQEAKSMYLSFLEVTPGGRYLIKCCGWVGRHADKIIGNSLLYNRSIYFHAFCNSDVFDNDTDDDDYTLKTQKVVSDIESLKPGYNNENIGNRRQFYSSFNHGLMGISDDFRVDENAREIVQDFEHSIHTPVTPCTLEGGDILYNEESFMIELQDAAKAVERETQSRLSTQEIDEMKYLYY